MIPRAYITAWQRHAPWAAEEQVEQDLVISRAIVEIFREPRLADALAFRGGTALYKLHLQPGVRYSEDIDLVQVEAGAFGAHIYQRRKGRDLFDLAYALESYASLDTGSTVDVFQRYLQAEAERAGKRFRPLTYEDFDENLAGKLRHPGFLQDLRPLLPLGEASRAAQLEDAADGLRRRLLVHLPRAHG